jgi:hypothetical protein
VNFNFLFAAWCTHGKAPDFGGMVGADLFLFCIKPDTSADQVATAIAPYVKGHLKADNKNAFMKFAGTIT